MHLDGLLSLYRHIDSQEAAVKAYKYDYENKLTNMIMKKLHKSL